MPAPRRRPRRSRRLAAARLPRRPLLLGAAMLAAALALWTATSGTSARPASERVGTARAQAPPPRTPVAHDGTGRAIDRVLRRTSYIARGTPRRKEVALTFDDGPGPDTPKVLRWLRAHRVPATFFLIGRLAAASPAIVRTELRDGNALGDHTQDHLPLASLGAAAQIREIIEGARTIEAITHRPVRLFRPPYGSFDGATLAELRRERMLMVLWSADTKDYERPGVARIVYTALSGGRAGSVILMHDGGGDRSQTLAALPAIVHHLRLKGYRLVTIPQLLERDPPPADQPLPRSLSGG